MLDLENVFKYDDDNGGGGGNAKVTIDQSDLELRLNNKFAEGAKKESKRMLEELGFQNLDEAKKFKEDFATIKAQKETVEKELVDVKGKLTKYDAIALALKSGASQETADDVIALVRGKGEELTEENIKKAIARFSKSSPFGTLPKERTNSEGKKIPTTF